MREAGLLVMRNNVRTNIADGSQVGAPL